MFDMMLYNLRKAFERRTHGEDGKWIEIKESLDEIDDHF